MTASGHRLTVWTRASWALYGGSPRGRVCPSRGRFLTRISVAAGEVAFHLIYDVIADVEAKTSCRRDRHARRRRGANGKGKSGDQGNCHMMMSMDLRGSTTWVISNGNANYAIGKLASGASKGLKLRRE